MNPRRTKSAGGVVVNPEGKVLVVNQNGDSWSLPKGHIDDGETALQAAKREVAEESGVKDLILVKSLLTYERFRIGLRGGDDKSEMKEIEMFLFRTNYVGDLKPSDPNNPEARWVEKEQVADLLTHPKDKEFFQKVIFEI
ncbi:MAG TPA: NUDIX domain-containing protein [Candidatus Paceibacterota bacterium]